VKIYDRVLDGLPGEKTLLLGNEAIARGFVEAAGGVAATYPGTPSSEVGDTLSEIAARGGFYFEISVNEKVALEVAYSAAISGIRSFAFMKHVGLNVAADALMSTAYSGVRAGMVVMTADDPSMFSSQNEQDNRHYAELSHLPMIEPSTPQEAKDYLIRAFEISEKLAMPVLFRTTTRVSHMRAPVVMGPKEDRLALMGTYPGHLAHVTLPSYSIKSRKALSMRISHAEVISQQTDLNRLEVYGDGEYGFITSGSAYNSLVDVIKSNSIGAEVLKVGMSNPIPENRIASFLMSHEYMFVVEELDPYLEQKVRVIAQREGIPALIHGKLDGTFPEEYEYSADVIEKALAAPLKLNIKPRTAPAVLQQIPPRPPALCPGCPHRATYYAVKRAVRMSGLNNVTYSSDIGCYSLGAYEPFEMADVLLEMGSSLGAGSGLGKLTDSRVVAFVGDSTFFHAGIPALINAVRTGSRMTLVVMDNSTTAMTGQQTNPGLAYDGMGNPSAQMSIEEIIRSTGVGSLETADPYDLKTFLPAVLRSLKSEGVSAVVARRECAILRDREIRKKGQMPVYVVDTKKCALCMNCVTNFSCPAIDIKGGQIAIDPDLCDGCGVCAEPMVCPFRAIVSGERNGI
jgi:indolepyruvate ferredoxin oxidoreductase alpha subunit